MFQRTAAGRSWRAGDKPGAYFAIRQRTAVIISPRSLAVLVRRTCLLAGASLLAACAAGPRYAAPAAPEVASYSAAGDPAGIAAGADTVAGAAQRFVRTDGIEPLWWQGFGSLALDALVREALQNNPDLRIAEETLTVTREQLRASQSIFFPQVDLGLGASRQRQSQAGTPGGGNAGTYTMYTGQVLVGYDLDVFGLERHLVRSARARVDVAASQLVAARLLVAGNVVQTTFRLASLADQLQAMHRIVTDQAAVLELVRTQYRLGAVDQSVVLNQESLLASSQADLTQLAQAHDAALHLLASYLGRYPAQLAGLPLPDMQELTLPADLPLSLPSALVAARPDIRAAEAALRGANEELGAAIASLYPRFHLNASYGGAGRTTGTVFDSTNRLWDAAASVLAPIFSGGRLRAEKRAAEASYRSLLAGYQSTVLGAFRDVANVLRALEHDSSYVGARAVAAGSAERALELTMVRYRAGDAPFLDVLAGQIQAMDARIALVAAKAQHYSDTAALYVALGGGDLDHDALAAMMDEDGEGAVGTHPGLTGR